MLVSPVTSSAGALLRQTAQCDTAEGKTNFQQHMNAGGQDPLSQQGPVRNGAERADRPRCEVAENASDEDMDEDMGAIWDDCDFLCVAGPSVQDGPAFEATASPPYVRQSQAKLALDLDQPRKTQDLAAVANMPRESDMTAPKKDGTERTQPPSDAESLRAEAVTPDDYSLAPMDDVPDRQVILPQEGLQRLDHSLPVTSVQAGHRAQRESTVKRAIITDTALAGDRGGRLGRSGPEDRPLPYHMPIKESGLPLKQSAIAGNTTSPMLVAQVHHAFGPAPINPTSGAAGLDMWTEDMLRMELQGPGATAGRSTQDGALPLLMQNILTSAAQNKAAALRMQLIMQIRQGNSNTLSLQLSPVELGSVRISMTMTDAGIQMLFQIERPETLELLRRFSAELAQDLRNTGFDMLDLSFAQQHSGGQGENGFPDTDFIQFAQLTTDTEARRAPIQSPQPEGGIDLRV